jgi:hypothetical protein
MSEPENTPGKNISPADNDGEKESANIIKILDELLSHTNSSRRLFLIFIASALFFGPAALILGGVLLGHPEYNIRHLETQQAGYNPNMHHMIGDHLQLVSKNGTIIREIPLGGDRPHATSIFLGLRVFIVISIIFAMILLAIAIKEYRFFSHWSKRFTKYKSLKDKIDKELSEE